MGPGGAVTHGHNLFYCSNINASVEAWSVQALAGPYSSRMVSAVALTDYDCAFTAVGHWEEGGLQSAKLMLHEYPPNDAG